MPGNANDIISITVDKFIFKFPAGLKYSDSGMWIKQEGDLARLGLADFAQQRNGDIAFANLPELGRRLEAGDEIASIETVKVNISLPSPMKGKVVEINPALEESPELINGDPYGSGWMAILEVEKLEHEMNKLLDAGEYAKIAKQQAEAELQA